MPRRLARVSVPLINAVGRPRNSKGTVGSPCEGFWSLMNPVTDTMSLARHIASERKTVAFGNDTEPKRDRRRSIRASTAPLLSGRYTCAKARGLVAGSLHVESHRRRPLPVAGMPEVHGDRPSRGNMCMQKPEIVEHHAAANLVVADMQQLHGLHYIVGEIAVEAAGNPPAFLQILFREALRQVAVHHSAAIAHHMI